ncbi:MAG: hypothetical protein KGH71_03705 [Candidatus Micrarchaeota archaeon]|nr:hypothetical protein [Candidatus Micrarchaeota archaeon]
MDFFGVLEKQKLGKEFGTTQIVMSSKASVFALKRPHTSLSMVADSSKELLNNQASSFSFAKSDFRYVIAKDISFDLLATFHDVNSGNSILLRTSVPLAAADLSKIKGIIGGWKRSNIEMRLIGMQSGGANFSRIAEQLHKFSKASLIELDVFGGMKRHIAFDLKMGASYDLLLLDRTYRAGELNNDIAPAAFAAQGTKLTFV